MSLIYNLGRSEIDQEGVKELVKYLETCIETLKNITEITNKTKSIGRSFIETELLKKIEDGILDSIHNANKHQLNLLLGGAHIQTLIK